MTSFVTRSKSKWSSSHESILKDDASLGNENSVDETSPYVFYSVLCTSDRKGNITLDNVKTQRFDSDVKTITTDSESGEEEIDDMKAQRYGFRTRRLKKYEEDDEFESSLGADLTDHSSDEVVRPAPSSDDETYDITTDNWTFVRGAKRKIEGGEKKTSPKRVKKKIQKNSLRIKFKSKFIKIKKNIMNNHKGLVSTKHSAKVESKSLNAIKKERTSHTDTKIKFSATNKPGTVSITTATSSCSNNTPSTVTSSYLLPSITKKLSHKIRCGYNATSSKIPEIRHIRRRRLNRTLQNEGSSKDDISTSSEDERENRKTARLSHSKRLQSSALSSPTVDASHEAQSEVTSIRSNYQFPVETTNNGLKIVIRRQSSDSRSSVNTAKTADCKSVTLTAANSVTSPYLKSMTSSPKELVQHGDDEKAELGINLPEATVVLERSLEARSSTVDAKLDEKEDAGEHSNEDAEEQNDEDKIQKELSTFVHHRPYKLQGTDSGSKFSGSKLRRNLKTIKTKKRRRKKREDKDVADSIDSKRTAMRLDMELPGHNWLLKKHQIKEKKMKEDDKGHYVGSSEAETIAEQVMINTGPYQASANSKPIPTESPRFQVDNQEDQACRKTTPNKGISMVGIVKPFNHLRMATTVAREIRDQSPPRLLIVDEDDAEREPSRIPSKEEISKKFIDINVNSQDFPEMTSSELVVRRDVMTAVQKNREISVLASNLSALSSGITLTAKNQVNRYTNAPTENNLSAGVKLASHINSQNVYSYKIPAVEMPMEVRTDKSSTINTFPVTTAKDVTSKPTNINEQKSSSACDKVPPGPLPKEESSEIESTIKISNCVSLALDLSTKKIEETKDEPLDLSLSKRATDSPEILDLSMKKYTPETCVSEGPNSADCADLTVSRKSVAVEKRNNSDEPPQIEEHNFNLEVVNSTVQVDQDKNQKFRSVIVTDEGQKDAKIARLMSPKNETFTLEAEPAMCDVAMKESTKQIPTTSRSQESLLPAENDTIWKQPPVSQFSILPMSRSVDSQVFNNTIIKGNQSLLLTDTSKPELRIASIRPSAGMNSKGEMVKFLSIPPHLPPVPPSKKIDLSVDSYVPRSATFNNAAAVNRNVISSFMPDTQRASIFPTKQINGNVLSITSAAPQTSVLTLGSSSLPYSNINQRAPFPNSNITLPINQSVLRTSLPSYVLKCQNKQVNNNAMTVNSSETLTWSIPPQNRQVSRHRSLDFQASALQPSAKLLEPTISQQQRVLDKIHDLEAVKRRLGEAVRENKSNMSHITLPPQFSRPPPKTFHQDSVRLPSPRVPIPVPHKMFSNECSSYKQPIRHATQPTSQSRYSCSTVLLSGPGNSYSEVVSPNILRSQGSRGVIQKIQQTPRFEPNQRSELLSSHSSAPPFNRSASFPSQTKPPPEFPVGFDPTVRTPRQIPTKSSYRRVHQVTQTLKPMQKMAPPPPPSGFIRNGNSKAQLNEPIVIDDDIIPSSPSTSHRQQRSSSVDGSTGIAPRSRVDFISQFANNPVRDQAKARREFVRQSRPIDEVCVECRKKAFFLCSGCRSVWYCSKNCQLNDWSKHALKCSG